VEGPWEVDQVRRARDYFEAARADHPLTSPWGLAVVVSGSSVCSPEALLALRAAALQDSRLLGRAATAWVIAPEVEGRAIMPTVLSSVYQDICPLAVFDNEPEAEEWLRQQLAELASQVER
jgi:hypothetical protein